ncbi:protein unzipped-like [Lepeophtheirus salmonis]|uniref:protein unzipped-like n=1 Tax=Lepeophtheirus salmonis TaxID=72036 RepID=UPI001AE61FB3|nr:uncharacterized protein LOC121124040 [Lepeophtheirus salmonis]
MRDVGPLLLLHAIIMILDVSSNSPAYILNSHSQLISSTSLKWVRSSGGRRPLNSVISGFVNDTSLFICRHILGGSRYEPGILTWEACLGIQNTKIPSKNTIYEVLVNFDGASRLEWANWTHHKDARLPIGAVSISGKELFAARSHDKDFGTLYFKDSLGIAAYITTMRNSYLQIGQVLVEHEALYFEIRNFRRGVIRSVHRDHVVLPVPIHVVIDKDSDEDLIYDYEAPNYLYFGSSGHGIPKGAPIQMYLQKSQNNSRESFNWGSPLNLTKKHKLHLSYKVPPYTKVRVDVKAIKTVRKYDFSATVIAHFRDGAIMMRGIRGVYKHVKFLHFKAIFGQPSPLEMNSSMTTKIKGFQPSQFLKVTTPKSSFDILIVSSSSSNPYLLNEKIFTKPRGTFKAESQFDEPAITNGMTNESSAIGIQRLNIYFLTYLYVFLFI